MATSEEGVEEGRPTSSQQNCRAWDSPWGLEQSQTTVHQAWEFLDIYYPHNPSGWMFYLSLHTVN